MLTIEEIKRRIEPIGKRHQIKTIHLFGSYARGEATEKSDVDLLIDVSDQDIDLFDLGGIYSDFQEVLNTGLDLVTTDGRNRRFHEEIDKYKVLLYAA